MNTTNFGSIPFIPGNQPQKPGPLSHFLPPVPEGVSSAWLRNNVLQGSWILDPFGASPRISLEAASAGYRILVAANNPITRFIIEMMADPPKVEDIKAALAELSASYVGSERTEPHIRSLYNTYCARCGQITSADAFTWEHGNLSPSMRSYSCLNCGDSGEYPCSAYDAELSNKFSISGMHKARALERVVAATDQDRIHVEQALSVYLPRALYALITIINKIEGLNISAAGQKYLNALLLYAFDQASSMWKVSPQKERRRQLTIPRQFRENNIWRALEDGIDLWSKDDTVSFNPAIPVTTWPELPPIEGGICIYEGRFINLADSLKDIKINSVCTAIPRPNQAFWTLSALWAGWLWGREAVGSFKSVLHRQRYDWAWHTTAVSSVFRLLTTCLEPATTIFGLINEAEPGFIGAALVAAGVAGCHLESMSLRSEEDQAQIVWKCARNSGLIHLGTALSEVALKSAKNYLEKRAEPASYLNTIAASFMGITQSWTSQPGQDTGVNTIEFDITPENKGPTEKTEPTPSLIYTSIYNYSREALTYRSGFIRYNLQDISPFEAANKNQPAQSSLFKLDLSNITSGDNDTENLEPLSIDSSSETEKERPTRSSDVSESTFLWLRELDGVDHIPITDTYELNLVNYLFNHPGATMHDIDFAMCELFTGLYTPDFEFIRLCVESYAAQDPYHPDRWYVRPEDDLSERKIDLENAGHFIQQIGERLGFICNEYIDSSSRLCITWSDKINGLEFSFFPMVSAAISELVIYGEQPAFRGLIVLPGSRANLLVYKLRRDLRIYKAFNSSQGTWRFLKFRHLRSLSESPLINRENLDQFLGLDPITYSTPQILLI